VVLLLEFAFMALVALFLCSFLAFSSFIIPNQIFYYSFVFFFLYSDILFCLCFCSLLILFIFPLQLLKFCLRFLQHLFFLCQKFLKLYFFFLFSFNMIIFHRLYILIKFLILNFSSFTQLIKSSLLKCNFI
jgi:hypothetical protein